MFNNLYAYIVRIKCIAVWFFNLRSINSRYACKFFQQDKVILQMENDWEAVTSNFKEESWEIKFNILRNLASDADNTDDMV